MINDDLGQLRKYAALGVRYLTLTHFKNNNWADSSTDKPAHNGLTPFGKDVVREMNRLGMMVDISHVADKTFYDALALTKAPVIASHSSCRAIANHPRNMTDDMMRALAKNGGVDDDQLPRRLPQRGVPRRQREEERHGRRGDGGDVEEVRRQRGLHDDGERADRSRGDGQGRAAEGDVGEDHRAHRPRGEGGRRRPRRPRLGLRRRDDAVRHGGRVEAAEDHRRAAEEGLLERTSRRSSAATSCG